VLEDRHSKRKYNVKAVRNKDEYELEVTDTDADLTFLTKKFTVKRGDQVVFRAWFEPSPTSPRRGKARNEGQPWRVSPPLVSASAG
jgi:hypothetical protein